MSAIASLNALRARGLAILRARGLALDDGPRVLLDPPRVRELALDDEPALLDLTFAPSVDLPADLTFAPSVDLPADLIFAPSVDLPADLIFAPRPGLFDLIPDESDPLPYLRIVVISLRTCQRRELRAAIRRRRRRC